MLPAVVDFAVVLLLGSLVLALPAIVHAVRLLCAGPPDFRTDRVANDERFST